MNELEQKIARAIAGAGGFDYERDQTAMVMDKYAQAALKAHAEYLAEQGLVVVPREVRNGLVPTDSCYETWFRDLKQIAGQDDLDAVDWAGYWMDAYSPADAWAEDQSYD